MFPFQIGSLSGITGGSEVQQFAEKQVQNKPSIFMQEENTQSADNSGYSDDTVPKSEDSQKPESSEIKYKKVALTKNIKKPENYTDFDLLLGELKHKYLPKKILAYSIPEGESTVQLDRRNSFKQTDNKFEYTHIGNDGKTTTTVVEKNDNGSFILKEIVFDRTNNEQTISTGYYNAKGEALPEEEFINQKYGFNPKFQNENSQVKYSQNGVEYQGDNYSIRQDGSVITLTNKDKNNAETKLDLDYLLREVTNSEERTRIMAAIQKMPGEAIADLANEIGSIRVTDRTAITEEDAHYERDSISINSSHFDEDMSTDELSRVLLHELGHAVEDHSSNTDSTGANTHEADLRNGAFNSDTQPITDLAGDPSDYYNREGYVRRLNKVGILSNAHSSLDAYAMTNENENFAERYADIMTGGHANTSEEILKYYTNTAAQQLEHIKNVKNSTIDERQNNSTSSVDVLLSPYRKKGASDSLNPMSLTKDENGQYSLTIYQQDNPATPLKIIKFNDDNELATGELTEVPYTSSTADEIIEYSASNPQIAYKTVFVDGKPVRTKIEN